MTLNQHTRANAAMALVMVIGAVSSAAFMQSLGHPAPDHAAAHAGGGGDHAAGHVDTHAGMNEQPLHAQTELLMHEWTGHREHETHVDAALNGSAAPTRVPAPSNAKPRPEAVVFHRRKEEEDDERRKCVDRANLLY